MAAISYSVSVNRWPSSSLRSPSGPVAPCRGGPSFRALAWVGMALVGWLDHVQAQSEAAWTVMELRFPGPLALLRRPPGVRAADSLLESWGRRAPVGARLRGLLGAVARLRGFRPYGPGTPRSAMSAHVYSSMSAAPRFLLFSFWLWGCLCGGTAKKTKKSSCESNNSIDRNSGSGSGSLGT